MNSDSIDYLNKSFDFRLLRLLNYAFSLLLITIFVLSAGPIDRIFLLFSLIFSIVLSYFSFLLRLLSLDGMRTAAIIGTVTLGLGGVEFAIYLGFFFLSSSILGKICDYKSAVAAGTELLSERRTSEQVWANSFWFVALLILYDITGYWSFWAGAVAAIAAATADTWATIIGSRSSKTYSRLIIGGKKVPKGNDGGISVPGTIGGFLGAAFIGVLALTFQGFFSVADAVIIFSAGFVGCLADSVYGYYFQHHKNILRLGSIAIMPGNHLVNFMATGTAALLAIILYQIIYALYGLV
ncbi:MAG: DUF92 domain-containing protein [Balneolales bacterium]|nr:DUF92 domain-containing protein [Balneolales bacterium]